MLWCAAWHQVPAGSLPDDDGELSKLAGYGFAIRSWRRVKVGALAKFVKCSDGRLYHPEICKKAKNSWNEKLRFRWSRECDRIRKQNSRKDQGAPDILSPTFEEWLEQNSGFVTVDNPELSAGQPPDVHPETTLKGEGEGEVRDREKKKEDGPAPPEVTPDARPGGRAKPKRAASQIPNNWLPSPEDRRFALDLGLDPDAVAANFRDYWIGTGKPMADWSATWRNWCRRQNRDGAGRAAPPVGGPGSPKPTTGWGEQARQKAELFGEDR